MVVGKTFQLGDRVRLSELGRSRAPRSQGKVGRIVKIPKSRSGLRIFEVLFDGNKLPTRLHRSYIEREGLQTDEHG
jgi:hypothetical protein